ncbi:hypothetical protein AFM11_34270 [Mycolicibacterium wolinskyi]|uniref:Uncharacterized protein n=1 Tax=Mycolicibacterium wolinskyi TaxID=59750 RepID=A0A132PBK3_9MYCO|nr:hypothetical protein AFM11_34270 [Mycolicibacterium wolinskyi]
MFALYGDGHLQADDLSLSPHIDLSGHPTDPSENSVVVRDSRTWVQGGKELRNRRLVSGPQRVFTLVRR